MSAARRILNHRALRRLTQRPQDHQRRPRGRDGGEPGRRGRPHQQPEVHGAGHGQRDRPAEQAHRQHRRQGRRRGEERRGEERRGEERSMFPLKK